MKPKTKYITYSLLLLTLCACDNKAKNTNTDEQEKIVSPMSSSPHIQLPSANNDNLEHNPPVVLDDDFRNAINSVVQDSIQEEVKKAVKDELSKKTSH